MSLCVLMACEDAEQPTKEKYEWGAVYNERRGQRGLGYSTVATYGGQTYWTILASGSTLSLCSPMACDEDIQPARDGHFLEVFYNEQLSHLGGLGLKELDLWLWLVIGH
uniref:Lipoprotein n=1 Tax=Mesocestoides corti TaxID=53468 RepID=A0A5K3FZN7_MESCO